MQIAKINAWILPSLLVCSLSANLLLTQRLRAVPSIGFTGPNSLPIGTQLPPLEFKHEDGSPALVNWNTGQPTLIYFFDPYCVWCKRNADALASLVDQTTPRLRFYSYTARLKGLDEFRKATKHSMPVLTDGSEDIRKALHLSSTPTTVLVDTEGKVVQVWRGAYMGATGKAVSKYFQARLAAVPVGPHP